MYSLRQTSNWELNSLDHFLSSPLNFAYCRHKELVSLGSKAKQTGKKKLPIIVDFIWREKWLFQ